MCELMGYSFAKPIQADFTMREFARRGEENADGWGLAWYPDRSLALVKEATRWRASKHTGFLETYQNVRSSICIAHVRHLTVGKPTHSDTHPFARELLGVEYCFAHNGTIHNFRDLPLGRFRPVGQTDSEHLFCHLLDEISRWDGGLAPGNWPRLHETLRAINQGNRLNCLLADGRRLFCYHDLNGWKGLQQRRVLIHDLEKRQFEDLDMRLALGGALNFGYVVATSPLSATGWEPFHHGELLVLEEGAWRYSSHRTPSAVFELTKAC